MIYIDMQSDKVEFSELEHYLKPVDSIFTGDELLEETNEFIINGIENKRYQQGQHRHHQQNQHQQRQQVQHNVDDTTKLWMWNNHAIGSRNEHKNQNSNNNNTTNYNNGTLDSNLKSTYSNFNYSLTSYHHHHPSIDLSGRPPLQVTNIPSNTSNHLLQSYQPQQTSIQQPNHPTITLTNAKDKEISLSDNHHMKTKINQVIALYSIICTHR